MRALLTKGDSRLFLSEIPLPKAAQGDVVIRVAAAGICGTDYAIIDGNGPSWVIYPVVPGHEVGAGVAGFTVGDLVLVDNYLRCNSCRFCKAGKYFLCDRHQEVGMTIDGGMAEYCRFPATNAVKIPEGLPLDVAALAEPVATAIRACRATPLTFDSTIAVFGCGPLGFLILKIAKLMGVGRTIMVGRGKRLANAAAEGADFVVDVAVERWPDLVKHHSGNGGVNVIYEASGSEAMLIEACRLLARSGSIVQVGIAWGKAAPILSDELVLKEAAIYGRVSGMGAFEEALALLASGRLNVGGFLQHQFPLERYEEAFRVDRTREGGALKVLVLP
jgi:threonine dehydrogenase-like Zn-dependent dehydrogenase